MMNYITLTAFLLCNVLTCNALKANDKTNDDQDVKHSELSDYFDKLAADVLFSGVVLVAKGNTILFEKACGMADRAQNVPNNVDTKFNLGSIGKTLTAVAVAQLVEQGKLSFDDEIKKYVDGFPDEIANKVTIKQLLTHTSGLGDIFTPDYMERKDEVETIEAFMSFVLGKPLRFEPGTQHQYSNAGFIVLGHIIEKISGEDYYDYIRKHITEPLGMNDTGFYKKSDQTPNLARGYTYMSASQPRSPLPPTPEGRDAMLKDNYETLPLLGNPSGGSYSTAKDMLKFSYALASHTLLSKESADTLMSGKVAGRMGEYGYGFEILEQHGHRSVGHSGGAPGVNALFRMLVDNGYTIVVLSNMDGGMRDLYEEIVKRYIP